MTTFMKSKARRSHGRSTFQGLSGRCLTGQAPRRFFARDEVKAKSRADVARHYGAGARLLGPVKGFAIARPVGPALNEHAQVQLREKAHWRSKTLQSSNRVGLSHE